MSATLSNWMLPPTCIPAWPALNDTTVYGAVEQWIRNTSRLIQYKEYNRKNPGRFRHDSHIDDNLTAGSNKEQTYWENTYGIKAARTGDGGASGTAKCLIGRR